MSCRFLKVFVLATVLAFSFYLVQVPLVFAASSLAQKVDVEITVKVNQKGFLNENGKAFNAKRFLKFPHGKVVRINFVFDEAMNSLAYGDTHQVAITGEGWTKESEKLWMWSQKASITFQTGEKGVKYRAYCILDCIGMEHLNNLIIKVV